MTDANYDAALTKRGWTRHHSEQRTSSREWGSFARCEDTVVEGWGETLAEARLACLKAIDEREALREASP